MVHKVSPIAAACIARLIFRRESAQVNGSIFAFGEIVSFHFEVNRGPAVSTSVLCGLRAMINGDVLLFAEAGEGLHRAG